jgi:glycolate oxidase FAD binding subunit
MNPGISSQSNERLATFEQAARNIVGAEHVRPSGTDFRLCPRPQSTAESAQPVLIEPATEQELAKLLKLANEADLAVIPRGGGTKLAWGNPPHRADILLSTARLNTITEHAWSDLTATVEAGYTIKQLRESLAQHGQRLALDPLWPSRATVGGVLSTNDSGALRLRFGSLRDLIIGVTIALPDGTLAKSGGKVVKNVAGYDLPKLVTGALGTLGVITQATFRLHPLPKESRTISCLARDPREAQRLLLAIQSSKLAHSAAQVRFIESMLPQIDVLFEATQAGLDAQLAQLKTLLAPSAVIDPGPAVWNARQELYSAASDDPSNSAVVKISTLPAKIADVMDALAQAAARRARCSAVIQATGVGTIHLHGEPALLGSVLEEIRCDLENQDDSLVVHHRPSAKAFALDAWGNPGDALPLMRALKQQFDPKSTLNPGRFVGGI